MQVPRRSYAVQLFTATRRITGTYQAIGRYLEDLNNESRGFVLLVDATFTPLSPASSLPTVSVPELLVSKEDLLLVCFEEPQAQEELRLLQRTERMILYVAGFAVRGDVHLGAEQQMGDMFDATKARFQPLTDVTVFPLTQTQAAPPREQPFLLLNVGAIELYHAEIAP